MRIAFGGHSILQVVYLNPVENIIHFLTGGVMVYVGYTGQDFVGLKGVVGVGMGRNRVSTVASQGSFGSS